MVMRETLDGFQGGLQIGGRMITNLRYADDITHGLDGQHQEVDRTLHERVNQNDRGQG